MRRARWERRAWDEGEEGRRSTRHLRAPGTKAPGDGDSWRKRRDRPAGDRVRATGHGGGSRVPGRPGAPVAPQQPARRRSRGAWSRGAWSRGAWSRGAWSPTEATDRSPRRSSSFRYVLNDLSHKTDEELREKSAASLRGASVVMSGPVRTSNAPLRYCGSYKGSMPPSTNRRAAGERLPPTLLLSKPARLVRLRPGHWRRDPPAKGGSAQATLSATLGTCTL